MTMKHLLAGMIILLQPITVTRADGDPVRGQQLALDCVDCHGDNGEGYDDVPRIAGLDRGFIFEQLKAFKSGERLSRDDMMMVYVEDLNDQDMADLAAYWSTVRRD